MRGKVVLITGASGALGKCVNQAFQDAGAQVLTPSRHEAERVLAQAERIDAFVHLVGAFAGGQDVSETSEETLTSMLETNLWTFFRLSKLVLPVMRAQRAGTLLAIGSRTALEPAPNLGAYSASKAALVSLVRTIALENRGYGISANILLPDAMDTPANRAAMPEADPAKWVQPGQVASTLVHLATTPDVTGAVIPIYGGQL